MKIYIAAFLSILGGMIVSTVIGRLNGVPVCAIYGYCEGDPIKENERLRAEIKAHRAKIDTLRHDADEKIIELNKTIDEQAKKLSKSKDILVSISNNFKKGMDSENLQRAVADKLLEIADFLDANFDL